MSVCLYVCMSVCLYICISVYLYICISVYPENKSPGKLKLTVKSEPLRKILQYKKLAAA